MKTVIVGKQSNLSGRLIKLLPEPVVFSARELLHTDLADRLPIEPFVLILNQFQPATALRDVSMPKDYVELSLVLTARLLAEASQRDCAKVIYTSSASVYGDNVACREDDVPRPGNLHAGLKTANEYLARDACVTAGIDHTVVRLFNLYGGNDAFSVVSRIIRAVRTGCTLTIANRGNAIRDFVHVDDVARCYLKLLQTESVPIINVATGEGTSVGNIIDAVRLRGHDLRLISEPAKEIRISTADVTLLSTLVDIGSFVRVTDHVLSELI